MGVSQEYRQGWQQAAQILNEASHQSGHLSPCSLGLLPFLFFFFPFFLSFLFFPFFPFFKGPLYLLKGCTSLLPLCEPGIMTLFCQNVNERGLLFAFFFFFLFSPLFLFFFFFLVAVVVFSFRVLGFLCFLKDKNKPPSCM